ncbi:DUF4430 domain-containing protein [Brevibacillus ginsengisoli]|uniref:DUF4430 domain-containing protein n=1 Tax=Brevibacillus ginsengisoli TaxID=363854 RepID=UPI003CE69BEE
MRKKEWLLLILAVFVIAGAAFGLYTYRTAQGGKAPSSATPTTNQAEASQGAQAKEELPAGTPSVKLWVTRDFGATVLFNQQVAWHEGDTVMDLLKKNITNVETAYNGGFVQSINGMASQYRVGDANSKKVDWFFSVNGLMSDVGAGEYPVHQGDTIWWDYHNWDYAMRVPAQIGAFPHPFVTRVTGEPLKAQIMYAGNQEQAAQQLNESLSQKVNKNTKNSPGKGSTYSVSKWNEKLFEQEQGLILIGDRPSLMASPFVQKMMREREALGLFASFTDKGIQTYDSSGKPSKLLTDDGDAVILATKNLGNEMPILIVTGNSDAVLSKAVEQLQQTENSETPFQLMYSAVLSGDQVMRLPMETNKGTTP